MTFAGIARWLLRRRESNPRPRQSSSFTTKAKPSEKQEKQSADRKAASHGRKRFGEVNKRRVDKEIDGFVVPADGGDWTSCSDSDDSDWSIGWYEPQSSEFFSDTESDNSYAVLVPCYGPSSRVVVDSRSKQNEKTRIMDMIQSNSSTKDSQKYVEKWLASLKKQ